MNSFEREFTALDRLAGPQHPWSFTARSREREQAEVLRVANLALQRSMEIHDRHQELSNRQVANQMFLRTHIVASTCGTSSGSSPSPPGSTLPASPPSKTPRTRQPVRSVADPSYRWNSIQPVRNEFHIRENPYCIEPGRFLAQAG
jgi:hypothetical protein